MPHAPYVNNNNSRVRVKAKGRATSQAARELDRADRAVIRTGREVSTQITVVLCTGVSRTILCVFKSRKPRTCLYFRRVLKALVRVNTP